jgi:hypothetical protein
MPRSSAFRKATKAITKTREFFSYESPYLTSPDPASEASQGAYCADVPTRAAASSPESESDECESSDDNDDNEILDEGRDDLCHCKTCPAGRRACTLQKCDPKEVAAVAAAKKAKNEQFGSEAKKFPAWPVEMTQNAQPQHKGSEKQRIAVNFEELQDRLLIDRDLRDVVGWATKKILMLAVPLGNRALQQLVVTLFESVEAGSKERLEKGAIGREVEMEQEEPLQGPSQPPPGQRPPSEAVSRAQEKTTNTITRTPITEEEYDEISARSFYFSGILPHFSRSNVIQLIRKYGEVENCKLKLQSCNQKTFWLGFFTMASSAAVDKARRDLHGKIMGDHVLTVERPPDARLMRYVQAQLKNRTVATPTPEPKEPEGAETERRVTLADKQYIVKRIHELGHSGMDEVLEIIEREPLAVERISKNQMGVDSDDVWDRILRKLLDFFENYVSCESDDSQSRSASPRCGESGKVQGVLAEHLLEVESDESDQADDIPAVDDELTGQRKRERTVTKWGLLRGLKCIAEEYLKTAIALADEQFERFTDPSVMSAPNLPTGAYSILRNDLLAENIGRLLVRLRDGNVRDDLNRSQNIRTASRDPVARRWRTLRRDFPDIPNMISGLNPIRDDIRAWMATGRHLAPRCRYVAAADETSRAAIAKVLGNKDVLGLEDLAAFTRRLAEVDKDARFRLEKRRPAEIDPREAQWSEFLDLGIKTIERYPGLSRLIGLETRLPYHPNHEEQNFEDEQRGKSPKDFFLTPAQ